jgi:hypothetical protein
LFFSKELTRKFKAIMALLGLGMLLLFYWQPANFAFSLFKLVDSYWSRYSYLGIFILIFMAGIFYSQVKDKVQLTYTIPKLKLGSLISGLAALALLLVAFWPKIRQRSRK